MLCSYTKMGGGNTRKLLEVINIYCLDCGICIQVYAYVNTHQTVYINYVQSFLHQSYINEENKRDQKNLTSLTG